MLAAGWFGWQQWGILPQPPVQKVSVPVTLPPDATLLKNFDRVVAEADYEDQAMQQLYRVWGFDAAIDDASCDAAQRVNLRCVQEFGSLDDLLKLNYPAVVHLTEDDGREIYAVLLHVADGKADLLLGSERWQVSLEWLNKVWGQGYTFLWQLPESGRAMISKRSGAADVRWLESTVGQALSLPVRNKISRFDAQLEDKVRQFQKKEGLTEDGIAGEQTLLRLVIRSREAVPRLNGRIPAQQTVSNGDAMVEDTGGDS